MFEVGDDGFSHVIAADPVAACEKAGCCEEAAEECPVDAISIVDGQTDAAGRAGALTRRSRRRDVTTHTHAQRGGARADKDGTG